MNADSVAVDVSAICAGVVVDAIEQNVMESEAPAAGDEKACGSPCQRRLGDAAYFEADAQEAQAEFAALVTSCLPRFGGGGVKDGYLGVGNDRAGGVLDSS
jgi:hypothetical protein